MFSTTGWHTCVWLPCFAFISITHMLNLQGKSCDLNNQWTVEGGCIGERLCVHSGEGCVYMCVCVCVCVHCGRGGWGGALQNGVHHGRMCACTVGRDVRCALLWTSRWKEEGRKNVFGWLCGVGTVASCLACGSFDRLCGVVWPVAVLIGCVVLSGQWQFW